MKITSRHDIEQERRKTVVAEVFAAVDPRNNQKLKKDSLRLEKVDAEKRCLFYYTPSNRDIGRITALHPMIEYRRLRKEELMGFYAA